MANSSKGAGNFLGPLFIAAVGVVIALVVTFSLSDEEIPDQATVIADDSVEARPAGAGTVPEGEADAEVEGITDELDDVDPAAPDVDNVPAAGTNAPAAEGDDTQTPAAPADSAPAQDAAPEENPIVDETSGDGQTGDGVTEPQDDGLPEGRDAQTDLNPGPDQDIVEDTDDGGAAFVPTPSGPEGRDE